ncbi:uncharacterized protein LOC121537641 isoform X2 [Coregonus clupeaformis]|uniref:uncharacterized protein LOC121537641 isoform X2 n=1 Tax=Coregonus clupeaformis TaxID=59861 RepID=UPI001E1C8647|nr:uncharacterized protein LOC121537641 isoform X2 [Coregonus clupeaformis]
MDPLCTPHKEEKETAFMKEEEEEEEDDEEDDSGTTVKDSEEETDAKAKETEPQHQKKQAWVPTAYSKFGKEVFCYVGQEISIFEALDSYGAVIWPAALALCHYLETNVEQLNLVDKAVLELGAGPGLVSIVATLLGAWVTATDLPEILGNLRANLLRNTRGRCRYTPQAAALSWGPDVERTYPRSVYRYDYVLAADVVYHHDYLEELLFTMRYFCRPGTTLIWANKVRLETDLSFTENFQNTFNTTLLAEIGQVNIFMATCRETEVEPELVRGIQQEEEELEEEEEEERVTERVQEEENGLEEEEEVVEAVETTENEVEDETQEEGPKEDEENQEDSEEYRDVEEQHISTDPRSTSQSELEGLEEEDTQDSNVQQEERPVWVEEFVVEEDTQDSNVQQQERPVWVEEVVVEEDTQDSNVQQQERPVWVEEFVVEEDTQDSNVQQQERPVWVEEFVVEEDTQDSNVQQQERPVWVEEVVVEEDTQDSNVQQQERPVWVEEFVVEEDTQDSNVQQQERPVWVEEFVVEEEKRSEKQDNSLEEKAEGGDGSSQAWEEQTLERTDEGYEDDEEAEHTKSRCSTEVTDEDIIEELDTKETKDIGDAQQDNTYVPWLRLDREVYFYAGHKINIVEALDSYGGVIWPAALALCNYLETNTDVIDLKGKQVLELGSGTGLVSVVASLQGAQVTATDLPDVLSNLRYNLLRNTRGRSKYTPEVTALAWGPGVERTYPRSIYHYDYVLAADVVYHHDLEELLFTMRYFCRPGTTLIWANKVRLKTNLGFTEDFKNTFNTTLLAEMGEVKIFKATCRETEEHLQHHPAG